MEQIITYKGFEISPATEQLADSERWTLRVSVVKHRETEGVTNQTFFDAANTFTTNEEAEKESIIFGKKIIDGEVQGLNTNGL